MIERQKTLWGLNDPMWLQYLRYLKNMAAFDFGDSFFQNESVREILIEKAINTCLMIVPAHNEAGNVTPLVHALLEAADRAANGVKQRVLTDWLFRSPKALSVVLCTRS